MDTTGKTPYLAKNVIVWLSMLLLAAGLLPQAHAQDIPDTRGPIMHAGMAVVAEADGVEAPGYTFAGPLTKPGVFTAKWINSTATGTADRLADLYRKEITLPQVPSSFKAWITVQDYRSASYRLFVNGQMVSRGPADFGQDLTGRETGLLFYDGLDLTAFLHAGQNVIAVEVFSGTGLIFEAAVQGSGGPATIISDETWKTSPCEYLRTLDIHPEDQVGSGQSRTYDGTVEPLGWNLPGFNDAGWMVAGVVAAPGQQLALSELPPLMEIRYPVQRISSPTGALQVPAQPFQAGQPITVTGDASFTVQYDRIMSGHWGIKVQGGAGARIYLDARQTANSAEGYKRWVLLLRDGVQYFEAPEFHGLGTIMVTVRGVTAPVQIMDVSADCRSQPVAYSGSFTSNDTLLNGIWKDCRWSAQLNLQTDHLDSPVHQEPISDYGDYLIEDAASFNAFAPKFWLARQDFRKWSLIMQHSGYATFHTSYELLWLQDLLTYYDYSGDRDLIVELAPAVHGLIDQFTTYIGPNGILSNAPNYMFMDWTTIAGFTGHHPPAVIGMGYLTAFYYRALADGLRVAQTTQDQARITRYTQLRQQIKDAYNNELWSQTQGLYRDGKPFVTTVAPNTYLPADTNIETFSLHNNVLAVLYDLAPANQQQAIMDKVMAMTQEEVSYYYQHFVLSALGHAGSFERYGLAQIRTWAPIPETHTFNSDDFCHGWVATPLFQMSTQVLGITPESPGFARVAIRPKLCDLTSAQGSVPTPHGNVGVQWAKNANGLTATIVVPAGTQADLALPVSNAPGLAVTVNGHALWSQGAAAGPVAGVTNVQLGLPTLDMTLDPGTFIFATTDNGTAPTNSAPTALMNAIPTTGTAPLAVAFNATGSSDPDGDALTFAWTFGDGGATATGATANHTYTTAGTFTASVAVSDGHGHTSTATHTITIAASGGAVTGSQSGGGGGGCGNGFAVAIGLVMAFLGVRLRSERP